MKLRILSINKFDKHLTRWLNWGVVVCTLLLIISVVIQIFSRFLLENAPSWTEEASRIFFIYAISFAAGIGLKDGYFVAVDILYDKVGEKYKLIIQSIITIGTVLLFGIILVFSIPYVHLGSLETSPSLGISMAIPFFSIFILSFCMCFYCIYLYINYLNKKK